MALSPDTYREWGIPENVITTVGRVLFSVAQNPMVSPDSRSTLERINNGFMQKVAEHRRIFQDARTARLQQGEASSYAAVLSALSSDRTFDFLRSHIDDPDNGVRIVAGCALPTDLTERLLRGMGAFRKTEDLNELRRDPSRIGLHGYWELTNLATSPRFTDMHVSLVGLSGLHWGMYRLVLKGGRETLENMLTAAPPLNLFDDKQKIDKI